MQTLLQFGDSPPVALPVREETWIHTEQDASAAPISDVRAATLEAIAQPLGFPPLAKAVVAGDRVALALGEGVRGGAEVVGAVVAALNEVGVPPARVSVVVGTEQEEANLGRMLREEVDAGLEIVIHDPCDDTGLVFVAAVDGNPLRLNRHLGEADFVIPIACARHQDSLDARGPFEAIFPRFSDAPTIATFHGPDRHRKGKFGQKRGAKSQREETERAGWLLGACFVVETVPARGGGIAAVLAGEPHEVMRKSSQWCERVWQFTTRERASLVVTTLGGGGAEQTWENVARALHAARRIIDEDQGAIAICTEVEQEPGAILKNVLNAREDKQPRGALTQARGGDALQAREVYEAVQRGPVYFMSGLSDTMIEDLGMAPLANYEELERLMSHSGPCLVIHDGQHAVPLFSER